MADQITLEEVQITFANWQSNTLEIAQTDEEAWRIQLGVEMEMLKLELLAEIADSLSKVANLGDCVTEKNQLQTNTEVWNEDDLAEKRLDALRG